MKSWALYSVGDHVEYDLEEYEVLSVTENAHGWYEYDLKPLPYDLLGVAEEELESI